MKWLMIIGLILLIVVFGKTIFKTIKLLVSALIIASVWFLVVHVAIPNFTLTGSLTIKDEYLSVLYQDGELRDCVRIEGIPTVYTTEVKIEDQWYKIKDVRCVRTRLNYVELELEEKVNYSTRDSDLVTIFTMYNPNGG